MRHADLHRSRPARSVHRPCEARRAMSARRSPELLVARSRRSPRLPPVRRHRRRASAPQMCRRCGVRFGEAPPGVRPARVLCPVCYRETDPDGRLPSFAQPARRLDINAHVDEHDRFPVGDDDWLETLRAHDRIRIGRWTAPVRPRPPVPRDRRGRRRTQPACAAQLDRDGDDPDPALGHQPGASWATRRSGGRRARRWPT